MKTIIQYFLEKYKTLGNTVSDLSFDHMPFLYAMEPLVDMKGQRASKSYFDTERNKEAVRIIYEKIEGDHSYNGQLYQSKFLGIKKTVLYFNHAGEIITEKPGSKYMFALHPVFAGDGTETIIGFSSPKQRRILKQERINADDYLQAQNPPLYALLYSQYGSLYDFYLKTGDSANLIDAINTEASPEILEILNNTVFGSDPAITVKELILMNLQTIPDGSFK